MGTFQVGLLLIGTFALLLALSDPVSVSIIISSVVTMASTLSLDLGTFVASQRMVGGVDSFSLLAVPFYILCGVLMNTGGIAQKLIDFAKILVGRIPGGLAHTNILGNTLFGSLSGSSVAASVAIGGVLIPMEEKEGYDKKFAAAVNIASAPTASDHSSFRHPDHLSGAGWLLCGGHDHVRLHPRPDVGTGLHGGGVCHRKEEPLSHCW